MKMMVHFTTVNGLVTKKMDMVLKKDLMDNLSLEHFMWAIGSRVNILDKENCMNEMMETYTKANFQIMKLMGKVFIIITKDQNMKEN